jgi:aryl-alcohol dehydrogenase-like predicted oxidoreductase
MEMTYRPLGRSGLMVSAVGVGCNAFSRRVDQDGVTAILDASADCGVTLLDTSDTYGIEPGASESMIGVALRGRRDDFVLATKFGMDMRGANGEDHGVRGSRRYIRRAVEASLQRLQTDHIDLYQLHEPDPVTPIEETLTALDELVGEGKVRYVGCSNFPAWQLVDASWVARTSGLSPFISVQNRYSLLDRTVEAAVTPAAEALGVGILPFFPLERGLLTGKYARGSAAPRGSRAAAEPDRASWLDDAPWDRIAALTGYADKRGLSVLDVAIAGLAAQPGVGSVISGATSAEQVRANAAALRWQPTADDLAQLNEL